MLNTEPISSGIGVWKQLDLYTKECSDEQIYYLLLGAKKTRNGIDRVGLMVINVAPESFKRLGYFVTWHEGSNMWDTIERMNIILI